MSPWSFNSLGIFSLFLLFAGSSFQMHVQQSAAAKRELTWSLPGIEISDVQFSQDGKFIALVTRVHWPDGDEAESLPESFFKKLEGHKRVDPRFADPIIKVIDSNGATVCEARYGIHPQLSADNKKVLFARQKKPISGLRSVAESLAGNDIQFFDCTEKRLRTLAEPSSGYLDTPILLPDGHSIAYSRNEPVNGAFGGSVEILEFDLGAGSQRPLFNKTSTPAIPCPPAGSTKSDFQAKMCSQSSKLSQTFPDLILGWGLSDGKLLVLDGKPLPAAGDIYLAHDYVLNIISVYPTHELVFSMGKGAMNNLWNAAIQTLPDGNLLIFSEYWKSFSIRTKEWTDLGPQNKNRRSVYSPDMKYYLAAEPEDEPDHFALYRVSDGKKLMSTPKASATYGATWSRDSKRFATVVSLLPWSARAHRENLIVYSLP